MSTIAGVDGLEVTGPIGDRFDEVLIPGRSSSWPSSTGSSTGGGWSGSPRDRSGSEDAATAELSRSQVWHWLHSGVRPSSGETITRELVERTTDEEMKGIAEACGDSSAADRWDDARALFPEMALSDEYSDFLTLPAYERMP